MTHIGRYKAYIHPLQGARVVMHAPDQAYRPEADLHNQVVMTAREARRLAKQLTIAADRATTSQEGSDAE